MRDESYVVNSYAVNAYLENRAVNARSARVVCGRGSDFETMPIPNGAFPCVIGHLEILGEFEAIGWAGVFAQAAEHAARCVIGKRGEDFAARGIIAKPAHDNQIFRARERAQVAGDTQRFARFWIHVQARRTSVTFGDHGALQRILLGVNILGRLITERQPHPLEQVHKEETAQKVFHRIVV